jgi:hypothetical protein
MTLSARAVYDETERLWKKPLSVHFKMVSQNFARRVWGKLQIFSVRTACLLVEIRIRDLPNTKE